MKSELSQLVSEMKKLREDIDLAMIKRSDDMPQSISLVIQELTRKIEQVIQKQDLHVATHAVMDETQRIQNEKMNAAFARIEPYIKEAEDNKKFRSEIEDKSKWLTKWGTRWLVLTAVVTSIYSSIYYGVKHIK